MNIKQWPGASWDEIRKTRGLQYFGCALAIIHLVSACFFIPNRLIYFANDIVWPVCYPLMEGCEKFRYFNFFELKLLVYIYAFMSVVCAVLFLYKKYITPALIILTGLLVFKLFINLGDYRIAGNQHFIAQIVTFTFLFFKSKKKYLSILIPGIYFCAGTLKFNIDWLSGESLILPSVIQGPLLSILLVYVIIIEIFIVWLLLSSNKWLRWFALSQLILFHTYSWHIVGYLFPLFMYCILSFFIFVHSEHINFKNYPKEFIIVIGIMLLFQFSPLLLVKDPALDARYRIMSLNLMDVKIICERRFTYVANDGETKKLEMPIRIDRPRIACDPQLTTEIARKFCLQATKPGKLSVYQRSRRSTSSEFINIVEYTLNCPGPAKVE